VTETAIETIKRLEDRAAWHRVNAIHAGSAWVWDARLRTAEDLERQAADLRSRLFRDDRDRVGGERDERPSTVI
jgi:hypothetical protein